MAPAVRLRLILGYAMLVGSNAGFTYLAAALGRIGISPSATAAMLLGNAILATLASPWWSDLADRNAWRARLLPQLAGASFVLSLGFFVADDAWVWALLLAAFGVFRGGTGPLLDGTTVTLLGVDRDRYARMRAAGSLGFLALALPAAWLHDAWPRGAMVVIAACLGVAAIGLRGLPETGSPQGARTAWLDLVRHPTLGPLSLAALLHGWTLTTYDQFFSVVAEARGLPGSVTGQAIVVGVAVEIGVMAVAPWVLRRFEPRALLVLSIASGAPRWFLTGTLTDATSLVLLQGLHGLTFATFWVAGVAIFALHAPPGRESSAQALFTLASYGVGRMIGMGAASVAFAVMPAHAWFRALSLVSLAATITAARALRPAQR